MVKTTVNHHENHSWIIIDFLGLFEHMVFQNPMDPWSIIMFPYFNSHFGAIFTQTQPCCAVPKFTPQPILQPILQPLGAAGLFMPCQGRSRRVAPGWLWWRLRAAGCHDAWRGRRPSDWKRTQTLGRSLGFEIEGSGFTKHVFWYYAGFIFNDLHYFLM